MQRLIRVL